MLLCYKKIIRKTLESAVKSKNCSKSSRDTAERTVSVSFYFFLHTRSRHTGQENISTLYCCAVLSGQLKKKSLFLFTHRGIFCSRSSLWNTQSDHFLWRLRRTFQKKSSAYLKKPPNFRMNHPPFFSAAATACSATLRPTIPKGFQSIRRAYGTGPSIRGRAFVVVFKWRIRLSCGSTDTTT